MRKSLFIVVVVFILFILQMVLSNLIGAWFTPNVLLLACIYFNLAFGIRYGLMSSVFSGVLMDSFSISLFGTYLFLFVFCAFMTIVLKRYLYHMGSGASRTILVILVCCVYVITNFILFLMVKSADAVFVLKVIFVPDVVLTVLISEYLFRILKKCALKLFV